MELIGKRNPFEADYTVEVTEDGKLHSVSIDYYIDCGSYVNDSILIMEMAFRTCDNAYYCPKWKLTPHFVVTNTPANTSARAPGCCPAIFIIETIMDHVAQTLNISPDEIRYSNLYEQGQVTPYHQPLTYCSLQLLWNTLMVRSNYTTRQAAVATFNDTNRWKKRGIALQPIKFGHHVD